MTIPYTVVSHNKHSTRPIKITYIHQKTIVNSIFICFRLQNHVAHLSVFCYTAPKIQPPAHNSRRSLYKEEICMSFVKQSNANSAATILSKLSKRGIEGYFFETCEEAVKKALSLMPEGSSVSWGGSMSISECGLMDAVKAHNYKLIDRATAVTPEEKRTIFAQTVMADYYLMSTNAVTMDGELVNIDGFGNRVACLCSGPEHVLVIAGMNKVVLNVQAGLDRIRTKAAPPNTTRLKKDTPCARTGVCGNCFSPDCICSQIVVTRRSGIPGRIKLLLVNESLGF